MPKIFILKQVSGSLTDSSISVLAAKWMTTSGLKSANAILINSTSVKSFFKKL